MTGRASTHKAYLRGAIWMALLATIVLLPRPADAEELSDADKASNNSVALAGRS